MTNRHEPSPILLGVRDTNNSRGRTSLDDAATVQSIVTVGTLSDIGKKRSSNQDSFCALIGSDAPPGSVALLAVADGMGGHKAGEVASEMAIQDLIDRLSCDTAAAPVTAGLGLTLERAFAEVNAAIHTAAALPETHGMGTTLTAAVISDSTVTIGHVGDSRAYLLRGGTIRQLTQDHSWVAEQITKGLITSREADLHPGGVYSLGLWERRQLLMSTT